MTPWWLYNRGSLTSPSIDLPSAVRPAITMTDKALISGDDTPIVRPSLTTCNYEGVS